MEKRLLFVAVAAVVLLVGTGCSGSSDATTSEPGSTTVVSPSELDDLRAQVAGLESQFATCTDGNTSLHDQYDAMEIERDRWKRQAEWADGRLAAAERTIERLEKRIEELENPSVTTTTVAPVPPSEQPKGDGFYQVGVDIAPGLWRSTGTGDECYWERLDENQEILDNHYGAAGGSVKIRSTDYEVQFKGCGRWEFQG